MDTTDTFRLAVAHHQAGDLTRARELYCQVLEADPKHADALHLLGMIAYQAGQLDLAADLIQKALAVDGGNAQYHCNLGAVRQAGRQWDEACTAYRRALQLQPSNPEVHNNLGVILMEQGKWDVADAHFQETLRLRPGDALVHNNLGNLRMKEKKPSAAAQCYREALRLNPRLVLAHNNLGNALKEQGQLDLALDCYQKALELQPGFVEAHNNQGAVLRLRNKLPEALASFREALRLKPDFAEAFNNMGLVYMDQGQPEEAKAAFREALRLRPGYARPHHNLGNVLKDQGRPSEAIAEYRRALALEPNDAGAHSNLLFALNYDPDLDAQALFAEHCRWAEQHARPAPIAPHTNRPDPERRLRVGYVSPDFRNHSVARFLEPILAHHDPARVETFCYAEVMTPDAVTERLKTLVHGWRSTLGLGDDQVAEQIRADAIDLLIDLAGHTAGHRLGVFARKPAPVQLTYLGYPNTTGLQTIDYRLTDAVADPEGEPVRHVETLVRLPGGFCSYLPPADAPEVAPPPCAKQGRLTFGALHHLSKLNGQVLDLWADVLRAVPGAKLLVFRHLMKGETADHFRRQFLKRGIGADRLELRYEAPAGILNVYGDIDVFLDAFPWGGHTTTYEALWMGVPVLTRYGSRHAGRWAASVLTQLGLPELIAQTPAAYVDRARQLAADPGRLARWRGELRDRMRAQVCDGQAFTRKLEEAYRELWRKWCFCSHG